MGFVEIFYAKQEERACPTGSLVLRQPSSSVLSSRWNTKKCAAVAQLVERWSVDPEVDGSNPSSRTISSYLIPQLEIAVCPRTNICINP